MLNNKGFNLWANGYDISVKQSEKSNNYPFAGYKDVLNYIYNIVKRSEAKKILDIGFGTGILTNKLYDDRYKIHGIDFSKEMIRIAKKKMPDADLIEWDFTNGLPHSYKDEKFDFIISTYAIHHLTDEQKVEFLNSLKKHLNQDGLILVGDVSFEDENSLIECKTANLEQWDNDEIYMTYNSIKKKLNYSQIDYEQISFCAGIMVLSS